MRLQRKTYFDYFYVCKSSFNWNATKPFVVNILISANETITRKNSIVVDRV